MGITSTIPRSYREWAIQAVCAIQGKELLQGELITTIRQFPLAYAEGIGLYETLTICDLLVTGLTFADHEDLVLVDPYYPVFHVCVFVDGSSRLDLSRPC